MCLMIIKHYLLIHPDNSASKIPQKNKTLCDTAKPVF